MAREMMASTDAPAFSGDGPVNTVLQVAVPVPLGRGDVLVYDYYPPQLAMDLHAQQMASAPIQRGTIIKVPLGSRSVWGIVMGFTQTPQTPPDKLKHAVCVADSPPLADDVISFLTHVSRWTLASFGAAMKLVLNTPAALEPQALQTHFFWQGIASDEGRTLSQERKRVLGVAAGLPPLPAPDLAREAAVSPAVIRAMATAGQLQTTELPRAATVHGVSPERMAAARENLVLSEAQGTIAQGIAEAGFDGFQAHLLDGVTGLSLIHI